MNYTLTYWLWLILASMIGWALIVLAGFGVNEVAELIARMVESYV